MRHEIAIITSGLLTIHSIAYIMRRLAKSTMKPKELKTLNELEYRAKELLILIESIKSR